MNEIRGSLFDIRSTRTESFCERTFTLAICLLLSFSLLQEIEEARRNLSAETSETSMVDVTRVTEDWLLQLRFKNFVQYMSTKYGEDLLLPFGTSAECDK